MFALYPLVKIARVKADPERTIFLLYYLGADYEICGLIYFSYDAIVLHLI